MQDIQWVFPETPEAINKIETLAQAGQVRILDRTQAGWHAPFGGLQIRGQLDLAPREKRGFLARLWH